MNAYEIPNLRFSMVASAALARHRFVTVAADGEAAYPSAGGAVVGVTYNQCDAQGDVAELCDGLVMVEAGDTVAAGDLVQTTNVGKAITRTNGIALGIAVTGATVGKLITVKCPAVSGTDGAAADRQVITVPIADLAAGADLADVPFYVVPDGYNATLLSARVIAQGANAGVDAANTSVWAVEVGATVCATKTFNNVVTFPNSGASSSLTVASDGSEIVGDNDVLTYSITNGATADLPACVLQVEVSLAKE